jgi:hypothetical protein
VVDSPTILYIPFDIHYSPEFRVWATSREIKWDRQNQLLYWYPAKNQTVNQIIVAKVGRSDRIDVERLPKRARDWAQKATFVYTFS